MSELVAGPRKRRRSRALLLVAIVGLGLIWWLRPGTPSRTKEGVTPDGLSWQIDHFDHEGQLVSQMVFPLDGRHDRDRKAGPIGRIGRDLAAHLRNWDLPHEWLPLEEGCSSISSAMSQEVASDGKSWQRTIKRGCHTTRQYYPLDSPIRAKYVEDQAEMTRKVEESFREQGAAASAGRETPKEGRP